MTLAAGLFLLGAPAMALTASGHIGWIVAICIVRGLGFAVTLVAGGALTASLIPPSAGVKGWRWLASCPECRRWQPCRWACG